MTASTINNTSSANPLASALASRLVMRLMGNEPISDYPLMSLTDFKHKYYRRYIHAPHLELLDSKLEQVSRYIATGGQEGIGQLIIEMPPRHGKTMTVSKLFPTWHLGYRPNDRIMQVSYGASLSHKNSRWARNIMRSREWGEFSKFRLAGDSQAVDSWDIQDYEGGMDAIGIDGSATGKGAHLLNIDDPFKNRKQAESKTYRDMVWGAFTVDLYTRLEPGGAVIVTQTRWHEDDLVGRILLSDEFGEWERLRLPAIAEEDDPLGRMEGDPLWAERYPLSRLTRIKARLGEYAWSALYQQNPMPSEGGIFKRDAFNRVIDTPELKRVVRFWDLAMSEKTSADYTVGVKLGIGKDDTIYILDVVRVQMEWSDVVPMMKRIIQQDGKTVIQGIEKQGYMSRAVQMLAKDADLRSFVIKGYPTDKDKMTRALPFAARVGAGLVSVVWRGWSSEYVDELSSFPNASHDDQVDASAGAFAMLDEQQSSLVVRTHRSI